MHFEYTPYLWLLAISFTILIYLAYYSFRYGRIRSSKAFSFCMLNFSFWVFTNGLEIASVGLSAKLFWANMQYFSYTTIHIFWLYMILQFTNQDKWIKYKNFLFLYGIPLIIIGLVWTDQYHGLFRYGFTLNYSGIFTVIDKSYGPLYWIHPIYGYTIVLISILLVARAAFIHRSIYRMQAIALLVSPIISIVPSALYVLSLSPIQGFDITPAFLGLSGLIAAIGLFRYQLFAIVPVARDVAVDNMNIGMIVIDTKDNIVDINLTAESELEQKTKDIVGVNAKKILYSFGIDWEILKEKEHLEHTFFSEYSKKEIDFEIQLLCVYSKHNRVIGKLLLIRDVSEIKIAQNKLLEQRRKITIAKEREKLANDLHDNLGQVLGFINVQAQGIRKELELAGVKQSADKLSKLVDVTQLAHNDIRGYINETREDAIAEKELLAQIISNIEQFKDQTEIEIVLRLPEISTVENLNKEQKNNIIYIFKEILNNIRKHSEAKTVQISITINDKNLRISIIDDGVGFDTSRINSNKGEHYGLQIMKERAFAIGANLSIDSNLKKGTKVYFVISI